MYAKIVTDLSVNSPPPPLPGFKCRKAVSWSGDMCMKISRQNLESREHVLPPTHYTDVIMSTVAPQITGISIVYSTVCPGAGQRIHHDSALLAFVRGIHRWSVDSSHKGPVTRKLFPFDDAIMVHVQAYIDHTLSGLPCGYTSASVMELHTGVTIK